MALVRANLVAEIRKITDQGYSLFGGFPTNSTDVAVRWTAAINTYASLVVPVSSPLFTARAAMRTQFLNLNLSGLTAFPAGFTAYAAQMAVQMGPSFTGTPPPVPIVLSSVFAIGLGGGSSEACAEAMATVIDTWFRTGVAVNNSTGAVVNWS